MADHVMLIKLCISTTLNGRALIIGCSPLLATMGSVHLIGAHFCSFTRHSRV